MLAHFLKLMTDRRTLDQELRKQWVVIWEDTKKQSRILEEEYSALLVVALATFYRRNTRFAQWEAQRKKPKTTLEEKKNTPPSCNSTLIQFSCEVPFVDVYATFFFPPALFRLPFSSSHLLSVQIRMQLTPTNQ
jgi:hypothetical protein